MADYINNTPVSPLRESNISKYISMMSEVDTVKALLNIQTNTGEPAVSKQKELNAAYAISDMFQSIAKEGMTVSEILEYMYKNYKSDISTIAKKIKIIHSPKPYNNNQDDFFLKVDKKQNKTYGRNKTKDSRTKYYNNNKLLDLPKESAINLSPKEPTRFEPNLVTIMHNDPKFRCGIRNSLELSTFWNLLSSIELSKMYPYLNATFKLPRFVSNSNQVFTTATVNQFLNGTIDSTSVTDNYKIFEAGFVKEQKSKTGVQQGQTTVLAGTNTNFSIFTMPQTVNNFNEKFVGHLDNFGKVDTRTTTVHDITRPFLTIHSFDIDIAPSQGLLSFKSGRISMTLHDRTRMSDIAPFVKPDLFGSFGAEIVVEYGWSHMDADDDENHVAQFLNKSRVIEKYIITNSSFTIQKDGSVKIDLGIAMRGPLDIRQVLLKKDPSKGASTEELRTALNALRDKIERDARADNNPLGKSSRIITLLPSLVETIQQSIRKSEYPPRKIKKKTNPQRLLLDKFINFTFSDLDINLGTNQQIKDDIIKVLRKLENDKITFLESRIQNKIINALKPPKSSPNRSAQPEQSNDDTMSDFALIDLLKSYVLYFNNVKRALKTLRTISDKNLKASQVLVNKIIPNSHHDAYINNSLINNLNKHKNKIYQRVKKLNRKAKKINTDKYISFGSFITSLIGTHMTATGKFDEIQIIFYTANENCGAMSSNNIASFLIEIESLESFLKSLFREDLQFTLESIIKAVVDNFISVRSQPCYGFSALFEDKNDSSGKKQPVSSKAKDLDNSVDKILQNISDVLFGVKGDNLVIPFKMPRIGISFDTLTTRKDGYNRTISKISLFDRNDNPFSSLNQITSNIQKNEGILLLNTQLANLKKKYALTASGTVDIKKLERQKLTKNQIAYFKESGDLINKFIPEFIEVIGDQLIIKNDKNGISSLKSGFKKLMPSTTYGTQNSGIITANVTTVNDGALNTIYLTRPDRNEAGRNYTVGFSKALPLRILPTQATVEIWGCPFINFAQYVFLDFETGTTIDNIYSVASLKHSITPGSFKTTLTLSYGDVYGKYETAAKSIEQAIKAKQKFDKEVDKKEQENIEENKQANSGEPNVKTKTSQRDSSEDRKNLIFFIDNYDLDFEFDLDSHYNDIADLTKLNRTLDPNGLSNDKNILSINFLFNFSAELVLKRKNKKQNIHKRRNFIFQTNVKQTQFLQTYIPPGKGIAYYTKFNYIGNQTDFRKFKMQVELDKKDEFFASTFYLDDFYGKNANRFNEKSYAIFKKFLNYQDKNIFDESKQQIDFIYSQNENKKVVLPIMIPKDNKGLFKITKIPVTLMFECQNLEMIRNTNKFKLYDLNNANNIVDYQPGDLVVDIAEINKMYKKIFKNKKENQSYEVIDSLKLIKSSTPVAIGNKKFVEITYEFKTEGDALKIYKRITEGSFKLRHTVTDPSVYPKSAYFENKINKIDKKEDYNKQLNIIQNYNDKDYLEQLSHLAMRDENKIQLILDLNLITENMIKTLTKNEL